ncbi:MAG TPA: hypothetical protein VFQ88_00445 [Nevskiaceae bacterium]|nr:hypothetical protein [Nevskiaceae bacterium]
MKFAHAALIASLWMGAAVAAVVPKTALHPTIVVEPNVQVQRFYGFAHSLDSGKYLYTEVHARQQQGTRWMGGSVTYFAPDGTKMGTKVLDFSAAGDVPLYRLELKNPRYSEGVSGVKAGEIYLFTQAPGDGAPHQATVSNRAQSAADVTGIERLIQQNFVELERSGSMVFPLASARRLDERRFSVTRLKDGQRKGVTLVRFKVELASPLRLFGGTPMFFSFDPATRQLVEYRGLSDVENPKTGDRYHVRIDYGTKPPADAPAKLPPLDASTAKR